MSLVDELTELVERNRQRTLARDGPGEFRCADCGAPCTRSSKSGQEYGHYSGCPRRPDDWPAGDKRVEHHSPEGANAA